MKSYLIFRYSYVRNLEVTNSTRLDIIGIWTYDPIQISGTVRIYPGSIIDFSGATFMNPYYFENLYIYPGGNELVYQLTI